MEIRTTLRDRAEVADLTHVVGLVREMPSHVVALPVSEEMAEGEVKAPLVSREIVEGRMVNTL
jgi:hypothetical protein